MDLIAAISQGLTYSSRDLRAQIEATGWQVSKIKFDQKLDEFVATAKAPHGEEVEKSAKTEKLALGNLLLAINRLNHVRSSRLSRWTTTFIDQLPAIAEAYAKAPIYDPKASAAFMELGRDSEHRADALAKHLEVLVVNDPEPYKTGEQLHDDVRKRRRLKVSRAGIEHPIWSEGQVIAYRICHDVLGYVAAASGFDWHGENQAFAAHVAMLPAEAQKALFTESIASAAYASHYRAYGPEKVALFPAFMDRAQEHENPHKLYPGVHPSQSFPPLARPRVKPIVSGWGYEDQIIPKTAQDGSELTDPNAAWFANRGFQAPVTYPDGQTLAEAHGDPLQAQASMQNAKLIDTEWAYMDQHDPGELAQMKLAIVNAFRVVLLSPQKDLRWNAVHYQDIADIPADISNPSMYWNALEKKRQDWNVARYRQINPNASAAEVQREQFRHRPEASLIPAVENILYQKRPDEGYEAAKKKADQMIFEWRAQAHAAVMQQDADKPEEKRMHGFQVENEANKRLVSQMESYIKEFQPELDHRQAKAPPQAEGLFDLPEQTPQVEQRYGAFMGTHLIAISQISQHADAILKAALEDVHEHDGAGHHFRAQVLQLGVQGVGPKVCSFAWLLLQPMTSQLATIDTWMMKILGHNYDKEMNNRDYFKFERELGARKDAAGYAHMPLGGFQWASWDAARTGLGSHQDHSAMRVLEPTDHAAINWEGKTQFTGSDALTPKTDWWAATDPAAEAEGDAWDQNEGSSTKANQIPYGNNPAVYTARTAASIRTPWFEHPESGEQLHGQPGETIMSHAIRTLGLSTPEVWARVQNAGKI